MFWKKNKINDEFKALNSRLESVEKWQLCFSGHHEWAVRSNVSGNYWISCSHCGKKLPKEKYDIMQPEIVAGNVVVNY